MALRSRFEVWKFSVPSLEVWRNCKASGTIKVVSAASRATFIGDEGALLEVYGAQAPDVSDAPHVTEANLYVAAPFTGGFSLKMGGTGTLLLTNAVSSTSGGIEVTNGTVRIATAPAALKAHLAETTGSIMIGRVGTLFLLQ